MKTHPDVVPGAHAYRCACLQCKSMAAAIGATNYEGSSFFTDAELFRLALQNNAPCECQRVRGAQGGFP